MKQSYFKSLTLALILTLPLVNNRTVARARAGSA